MIRDIPFRKRAGFSTVYSLKTLEALKTDQIVAIVQRETDYVMIEGVDYNRRMKRKVILKALSILNNPDRTIFNDKTTVKFKN